MTQLRKTSVDRLELQQFELFFSLRQIRRDVELLRACQIDDSQLNYLARTLAIRTSCSLVYGLNTSFSYLRWKIEWDLELLILTDVELVALFYLRSAIL